MRAEGRKRHRGFTFIEALFALLIVAMVLGALTQTLKQAAEVKKNTVNMDQSIEEFHALITMANEVSSALLVISPKPGTTDTKLEIQRINPALSLVDRTDSLTGDPLDPFEPNERINVVYEIDNGMLMHRVITPPSGGVVSERVIKCKSFEAKLDSALPSLLTITLEVEGTRVSKKREIKVAVRG